MKKLNLKKTTINTLNVKTNTKAGGIVFTDVNCTSKYTYGATI